MVNILKGLRRRGRSAGVAVKEFAAGAREEARPKRAVRKKKKKMTPRERGQAAMKVVKRTPGRVSKAYRGAQEKYKQRGGDTTGFFDIGTVKRKKIKAKPRKKSKLTYKQRRSRGLLTYKEMSKEMKMPVSEVKRISKIIDEQITSYNLTGDFNPEEQDTKPKPRKKSKLGIDWEV